MFSEKEGYFVTKNENGGLNPSFNGTWSASWECINDYTPLYEVLILLLMEYGLREKKKKEYPKTYEGLNPSFNGTWSASHVNHLDTEK